VNSVQIDVREDGTTQHRGTGFGREGLPDGGFSHVGGTSLLDVHTDTVPGSTGSLPVPGMQHHGTRCVKGRSGRAATPGCTPVP
jgi:hypothetical protein